MELRPTKRNLLIAAVILLLVGIYFWRGGLAPQKPPSFAVPVAAETVTPRLFTNELSSVGTLIANESVTIRPEISGIITGIHFKEGQKVLAGDLLFSVDDNTYRADVNRARATFELASQTFDRVQELQRKGASSRQTLDEAAARLKEARAAYDTANIRFSKTEIAAPFNGIIGLRSVSEGDFIEIGRAITNLESINPLKLEFTMPERFFSLVKPGQEVNVKVDAYKNQTFLGKVYALDPRIDPATRNLHIKAEVANDDEKLRPGMFAYVNLTVGRNEKALLIPEEALLPQGKEFSVYLVKDGKASMTKVKIGEREIGRVEILSGLAAGDVVITAGQMKLHEGAEVAVLPPETAQPAEGQKAAGGAAPAAKPKDAPKENKPKGPIGTHIRFKPEAN